MTQPNDSAALMQKADRALRTTESTEDTEKSLLNLFFVRLCVLCAESFTAGMSR